MAEIKNPKHLEFILEYLKDPTIPYKAYQTVYPASTEGTARANASKLLKRVDLIEYMESIQIQLEDKDILTLKEIMRDLSKIAKDQFTTLPYKLKAYHQLTGMHGGYKDNLKIISNNHHSIDLSYLSDDELDNIIDKGK